ncbi:MAG: hypothetical protein EOO64_00745, partial [Massilia sp.]
MTCFPRSAVFALTLLLAGCGAGDPATSKADRSELSSMFGTTPGVGSMRGGGAASSFPTTQLLSNPGFEGSFGWQATDEVLTMDAEYSYQGTGFAYLLGYNNARDVVYQ